MSVHVVAYGKIAFFFIAQQYFIVCEYTHTQIYIYVIYIHTYVYHRFFIHSYLDGHLGCFHILLL